MNQDSVHKNETTLEDKHAKKLEENMLLRIAQGWTFGKHAVEEGHKTYLPHQKIQERKKMRIHTGPPASCGIRKP